MSSHGVALFGGWQGRHHPDTEGHGLQRRLVGQDYLSIMGFGRLWEIIVGPDGLPGYGTSLTDFLTQSRSQLVGRVKG